MPLGSVACLAELHQLFWLPPLLTPEDKEDKDNLISCQIYYSILSSVLKLILRKGGQDRMSPCWKYASSISFLTKDVQSGRWDREGFPETPTGSRRDACLCLSSEFTRYCCHSVLLRVMAVKPLQRSKGLCQRITKQLTQWAYLCLSQTLFTVQAGGWMWLWVLVLAVCNLTSMAERLR